MKKSIITLVVVSVVAIGAWLLIPMPRSIDSDAMVVLKSLDGASPTDTLATKANLPCMPQQQEALYHIQNHTGAGQNKSISVADVLRTEYKIIPLETSEGCLVGDVSDVVKDDSLLFVVDRWNQYVYSFLRYTVPLRRPIHLGLGGDREITCRQHREVGQGGLPVVCDG